LLVILIFEGEILDDATNNIKVLKEGVSYPDSLSFTTLGGGVLRRQPHFRSGLATLHSVGAIP